jgi:hypothetical protein
MMAVKWGSHSAAFGDREYVELKLEIRLVMVAQKNCRTHGCKQSSPKSLMMKYHRSSFIEMTFRK